MAPSERQTLVDVLVDAGVRSVVPVDESVASAIGAGMRIDQPYGRMNIDIGGGRTNVCVFSFGHQIVWDILQVGGDKFDDAIIDYLRKKLKSRIKTRLTYKVARTFLNKIIENKQLIIKDVIGTEHMDALTSGAVITCNHFNAFDSFAMQIAYEKSKQCKKRRLYRVIREGNYTNFPGFYGMLMRNCYTFPLSSNRDTMKKFLSSMDTVLQHGDFMLVYPEQSMWWNYRKPKPLKKGAYTFAAKNHVPVLPCFITMEDSDILGDDGFYVQEYTIHIAEPIYPDPQKTQAENVDAMRRKNAAVWKQIYEEFYGIPLVYDTAEAVQYVGKPTNIA